MVRKISAQAVILDLTPQEVFDCAFGAAAAARAYHLEVDGDANCTVGEWVDGKREVVFQTAVNVPASLASLIGVKTITIREISARSDEGSDIVVHATPQLSFPGSSRFTTTSCMRLSPCPTGCQMTIDVTCEAAGPWGLIGTIEEAMASQAKTTIERFTAFCQDWCAQQGHAAAGTDRSLTSTASKGQQDLVLKPVAHKGGQSSISASIDSDDEFFDTNSATPRSLSASSLSGGVVAGIREDLTALTTRVHHLEVALRHLRHPKNSVEAEILKPHSWLTCWTLPIAATSVAVLIAAAVQYGRWSALSNLNVHRH